MTIYARDATTCRFVASVENYDAFGKASHVSFNYAGDQPVPVYTNEFWTSKQRAAHSLHEVSYRACFKPQLPRFFIDRLTQEADVVLDPFMGRGTTLIEAVLKNRFAIGCDINPLSKVICEPRLNPQSLDKIKLRLENLNLDFPGQVPADLKVFYHIDTLREICALRAYFHKKASRADRVDHWIRMVATNRLTGHSKGFFSVYTLPPNQAVSVDRQRILNKRRNQVPEYRNVKDLILKKSKSLLKDLDGEDLEHLHNVGKQSRIIIGSSSDLNSIKPNSVSLIVTSPPFLDVVDYAGDNWLRCWFNHIDADKIPIWTHRKIEDWSNAMALALQRMYELLKTGGYIAFEVGEVRKGKVKLEDYVIPAAEQAGLVPVLVLINDQAFTKTANCWGVSNLKKGTNTNRIVVLKKPEWDL